MPFLTFCCKQTKQTVSVLNLLCRLSTWRCPHLLLTAGACSTDPQISIDICYRHRCSAANSPGAVPAVDRWDRQTDGRTPHRHCSAYYAGSVNKSVLLRRWRLNDILRQFRPFTVALSMIQLPSECFWNSQCVHWLRTLWKIWSCKAPAPASLP